MWAWVTKLFDKVKAVVQMFLQKAITGGVEIFIAEFKDVAIATVMELDAQTLKDTEKRKQAFDRIKAAVAASGKQAGDSWINLLIEIAVQYLKTAAAKELPVKTK